MFLRGATDKGDGRGDVGDKFPFRWGGGIHPSHAIRQEGTISSCVVVGAVEEAAVQTGTSLPEGHAGGSVNLIANFPHNFNLIGSACIRRPIGSETRTTLGRATKRRSWSNDQRYKGM